MSAGSCKANGYVLVLQRELQPNEAEWEISESRRVGGHQVDLRRGIIALYLGPRE